MRISDGSSDVCSSYLELFDLIVTFGAGAIESTAATMGGALLTLCQHPDQFDRLKRDPGLIPTALEECMRYHGPGFLLFTRCAMVETELGGTPMPAGMPIYVVNQAASWDPSQYPDPMRFDIDRSEEHTSELQSLMRNSYAVFCLKKKN